MSESDIIANWTFCCLFCFKHWASILSFDNNSIRFFPLHSASNFWIPKLQHDSKLLFRNYEIHLACHSNANTATWTCLTYSFTSRYCYVCIYDYQNMTMPIYRIIYIKMQHFSPTICYCLGAEEANSRKWRKAREREMVVIKNCHQAS